MDFTKKASFRRFRGNPWPGLLPRQGPCRRPDGTGSPSSAQVDDGLGHRILGRWSGIGLVVALVDDEVHQFVGDVHVGRFQRAGLQRPQGARARRADRRLAGLADCTQEVCRSASDPGLAKLASTTRPRTLTGHWCSGRRSPGKSSISRPASDRWCSRPGSLFLGERGGVLGGLAHVEGDAAGAPVAPFQA